MGSDHRAEPRYRDGARAIAPLSVGAFLFGAAFGLLAEAAGFSVLASLVFSATTFAGSAQFAAASVLENGGGAVAAITAAVLLNARYVPISVSVASIFGGSRLRRLLVSQLIVDESWAVSGRGGRFHGRVLIGAGLVLYAAWSTGTLAGRLGGSSLGDPADFGLDAAFAALFLALVVPYLRGRRAVGAALVAAAIALSLLPLTPAGVPIVAAGVACLLGLRR